jgi:hypothetical protein
MPVNQSVMLTRKKKKPHEKESRGDQFRKRREERKEFMEA